MIKSLKDDVKSIVIGIRYKPNFGLVEKSGGIIDDILWTEKSMFDSNFFPQVRREVREKGLINPETEDYLRINQQDTIFEFHSNDINEIKDIVSHYGEFIIGEILQNYELTRIMRIGFVYRYEIDSETLSNNFLDRTVGESLKGINNINIRFSKKRFTDSVAKKEKNDYEQIIFNLIKETDSDALKMSVDYQHIYSPMLSEPSLIKFEDYIERVNKYNNENVLEWLNDNYLD